MNTTTDTRPRILIVEDEAIVAMDLASQLEGLGYEVVGTAATADDALRQAAAARPDLVLMDIHLEGARDGIQAARRLRDEHRIPAVFLTAYLDAPTLERARQVEPYGYLVKPFNERDLHATIQVALYKARADRELRASHEDLQAILDAQRQGTLLVDAREQVTFVSRAAAQLLGGTAAGMLGRTWSDVLPLDSTAQTALAELWQMPRARRQKMPARLSVSERPVAVEIELEDDPRDPQARILLVYDVSQLVDLRRLLDDKARFETMIGKSPAMEQVFRLIRDFAQVDSTVLIEGATGSGKELVARAIHNLSPRRDKPFLALNCAGLSDELAISQLFGHRRGAFTGAVEDQVGLFEAAGAGTLFLDEIGELSQRVQTTLLRALEQRQIMRLGETKLREVSARIITATNRDLSAEVAAGRFRADLLYRIRVARIHLPSLAQRREDIPILARAFLAEHCAMLGKRVETIGDEALALLMAYDWPGNVRELKNSLEYAIIRAPGSALAAGDLPPEILEAPQADTLLAQLSSDDREGLLAALERSGGNRKEAAQLLGISRATFYRRLAQFGMGELG